MRFLYNYKVNQTRIAFVLGSKFPTPKAYGVTTRETLISLINLSCEVRIFCYRNNYSDSDFDKISSTYSNYRVSKLSQCLLKFGEVGIQRLNQLSWQIGNSINLFLNLKQIKLFNPDIIWTRDPLIAFICSRNISKTKVILEVHNNNSKIVYKYICKHFKNISFFPINTINDNFLKSINPSIKTMLAPMSVNSEILVTKNQINDFILELSKKKERGLKIGYIGNIAPQGYSKGIEDLIKLSQICQAKANDYEIVLIGCTLREKQKFDKFKIEAAIKEKYLKFEIHLSHSEALKIMKTFDVLVLPLPQDRNYVGMPLKLLEYLAAGRITIIAKSIVTTSIFQNGFNPYYYVPGNPSNLFEVIEFAVSDLDLKKKISLGVDFASQYTWESRTERMLSINLV